MVMGADVIIHLVGRSSSPRGMRVVAMRFANQDYNRDVILGVLLGSVAA
jgi:hypothetical protein